jgi:hypothetical protein
MFIQDLLNLIIASDDMCYVLVAEQLKVDSLPHLLHLLEHGLYHVLFGGLLSHFDADVHILHQSHVHDLGECEAL